MASWFVFSSYFAHRSSWSVKAEVSHKLTHKPTGSRLLGVGQLVQSTSQTHAFQALTKNQTCFVLMISVVPLVLSNCLTQRPLTNYSKKQPQEY